MKKGIIVASFGTSYDKTRKLCIERIEEMVSRKYEELEVLRAFTSEKIRKKLKDRDGINIYNPKGALLRMKELNIKDIYIQPLHIIPGFEYEKIENQVEGFLKENEDFKISISKPLLYDKEDYHRVLEGLQGEKILSDSPIVFMGHGTEHNSDRVYAELEELFNEKGYKNAFIGTVEGSKTLEDIISILKAREIKLVRLRPFMLVAGDHAINDMASKDGDSWFNKLRAEGIEAEVELFGLGELGFIRTLFLEHLENIM